MAFLVCLVLLTDQTVELAAFLPGSSHSGLPVWVCSCRTTGSLLRSISPLLFLGVLAVEKTVMEGDTVQCLNLLSSFEGGTGCGGQQRQI